jgi:hypothetical protein
MLPIVYLGWIAAGFNLFSALLLIQVMRLEKLLRVRRLPWLSALLPGALFVTLGIWRVPASRLIYCFSVDNKETASL